MKSICEEEKKQIEKEYQEAEAKEGQKHMKYRWIWTPGGWLRVIITVGLLVGAAILEEEIPTVLFWLMMAAGLAMLVYSYVATSVNISKKEKDYQENRELLNKLNDNWVSDEEKNKIRAELRKRGLKI